MKRAGGGEGRTQRGGGVNSHKHKHFGGPISSLSRLICEPEFLCGFTPLTSVAPNEKEKPPLIKVLSVVCR